MRKSSSSAWLAFSRGRWGDSCSRPVAAATPSPVSRFALQGVGQSGIGRLSQSPTRDLVIRDGTYRFSAVRRIQAVEGAVEVWAVLGALLLRALVIVLTRYPRPDSRAALAFWTTVLHLGGLRLGPQAIEQPRARLVRLCEQGDDEPPSAVCASRVALGPRWHAARQTMEGCGSSVPPRRFLPMRSSYGGVIDAKIPR
jgi:hypothetical protein